MNTQQLNAPLSPSPRNTSKFQVEYTDLFQGEANYSWCRRYELELPSDSNGALIMRRAKYLAGLRGIRGRINRQGNEFMEFRPHNSCTVLFITRI